MYQHALWWRLRAAPTFARPMGRAQCGAHGIKEELCQGGIVLRVLKVVGVALIAIVARLIALSVH